MPNENCFFGACNRCNNRSASSILRNHFNIIDEDDEWTWSLWKTSNNKVDLHHIRSAISSLLDEIDDHWASFLLHSYYNREQRTCINDLRLRSSHSSYVTVQVDFAENYTVMRQREVQAAHWNNLQATLFNVHIKIGTSHKNMVIISDYMRHDTAFVYCAQGLIVQFLNQYYPQVVKINYLR
jgi:hypothetical protein